MKEENNYPSFIRKTLKSCFIFERLNIKVVILSLAQIHSRSADVVYISLFLFMSFLGRQTLQDTNETVKYTISDTDTLPC